MPIPKKGETRQEFMGRCVPMRHGEHPSEKNDKSVAICFSVWEEHQKKAKAEINKEEKPTEPKKESEAWQAPSPKKKKPKRTMK